MRVWLQDIRGVALQFLKSAALMAIVVLMIINAKDYVLARTPEESSPEPPPVQPLEIQYELHDYKCEADEKVIEAVADVRVIGGEPPYRYETKPGDLHIAEFKLPESGIQFRIEGGQTVSVIIKSATTDGEPSIIRDISAPRYLVDCEAPVHTPTPTPGATSTSTPTANDTPTPTPTSSSTSGPTPTRDSDDPEATGTPAVNPTLTHGSTPTGGPTPTDKPILTEKPTSTKKPPPTSPPPPPTSTQPPRPTPTSPPRPPTSTQPPPPPNQAECEDGRDNDGDGYTDMQDPQCRARSDNHEDK